jgi:hypothetical protein
MNPLLPQRADNAYRGHGIAPWVFGLVLVAQLGQGLMSIFNGRFVATSPDGIPLEAYGTAATQTIVALLALLGLLHVVVCSIGVLVLFRYRTLIPLMFVLFTLEYLGRRAILLLLPIPRSGAPSGAIVNGVLLALMIAGLALALRRRGGINGRGSTGAPVR